ncbi:MAG: LysR family transcriptional regulator [Myxococcales bacterium]|nr:LysR family transcriptional regulator [Myxococcales bacterium]
MDIPWDDVKVFLAVVEEGSLSKAARRLAMTQPTVSRRIAELEVLLAEALFLRSAGGATLTAYGERLVLPAKRMAESAGEWARAAERSDAQPEGVVRLTAAPGIAYEFVAPFARWLRGKLPAVQLEVISTLQYLDLSRREADLALRMQKPQQRDLVCLAEVKTGVAAFAAPAYAAKLPPKPTARDVDWIGWAPPLDHLSPNPQLAAMIPGFRPVFASDDYAIQLRAAEEGLGAVVLGRVATRFGRPRLTMLDLDLGPYKGELYLVCARSALAIPRVRVVAELLADELRAAREPPSEQKGPRAKRSATR